MTGAAIGAGALAAYSLAVEPFRLEVTETTLFCPRLPDPLDGLTVLLLADPHIFRWGRRERRLAELLGTLPVPDVAVLAGDLIQGSEGIPHARRLVRDHVRARYRRFCILGNAEHKLKGPRRRAFVDALRADGLTVLVNQNEPLVLRGATITVAGTDDPYYGHADLDATLAGAPPERFCLLLAHSPQVAVLAARAGVDVLLSGHTHGGQVRLPLVGALKTQNPLGRRVDQGLFDRARLRRALGGRDPGGDLLCYVSRGIGVARMRRLPLHPRLFCPPEVSWLTLRSPGPPAD
jgi:hypothetical protein